MHECGACSPDCTNDWCALETHCHRCGECLNGDYPCDECGLCKDCANDWADGMHCPRCGNCYQVTEQCEFIENNHCKECCEFNSMMAGCEDGSICVCDYNAWDERTCEACMTLFGDPGDLCETCVDAGVNRCPECCELASECSEKMCEYDDEYEDHFCMDCGECFRLCDEDENEELWESHRVGLATHSYDSNGVCTVCGYSVGNKLYIYRQPRTVRCTTSIAIDYDEDPANGLLWFGNHPVTFSVAVKGGTGSYTYQWYRIYNDKAPTMLEDGIYSDQFSGTHTATLTVQVSPEACSVSEDFQYYCVISDGKITVTTEKVTIKASHAYSNKYAINTESTMPENATYKAVSLTYINGKGETVMVTAPASDGHRHQCLCDDASLTRHYKTTRAVMHTFGDATLLGKSAKAGAADYDKVYEKTCTACGYKTYYETHNHVYVAEESDFEKYNRGTFHVNEAKTTGMAHALVCLVDGCGHIRMESHEWDWRAAYGLRFRCRGRRYLLSRVQNLRLPRLRLPPRGQGRQ